MDEFVAYYRVSTNKQGSSGLGLDAQKAAVRAFVESKGGKLLDEFQDVKSGKTDQREGFQAAVKTCKLKNATFLAAKFDRMSRNYRILSELQESGVNIQAVDMPEANKLTIGLFALIAEYESQVIGERTKAALQQAKRRGVKLGNPRLDEFRCTDPTKATEARIEKAAERNAGIKAAIESIQQEATEALSLREVAAELNARGFKTARGSEFHANTVKRILAA